MNPLPEPKTLSPGPVDTDTDRLLDLYPRLFMACHSRHTRDPVRGNLVSARQMQFLDHLDTVEPMTVGELAAHLGVTPSTVSITVDRLEAKSYVSRARDRTDRRQVTIRLTEAGDRIRQAGSVLDRDRVRDVIVGLSASDRALVIRGFVVLDDAISRHVRRRTHRRSVTNTAVEAPE